MVVTRTKREDVPNFGDFHGGPMIVRRNWECDCDCCCDVFGSDMPFERGSECPEMSMALTPRNWAPPCR